MRIIFMGTPDFAVPTLDALLDAGHEVVAVYTQPPRPGGRRGKQLTPGPVHRRAEELGIEVRHPESLKDPQVQADFAALDADVAIVAAYGLILPQAVLDAPKMGCLNVHASILPRWRGAAPVQRAILAGDNETGVSIMQMDAGLDTGPVIGTATGVVVQNKNAGELTLYLAQTGADLLVATLRMMEFMPLDAAAQPADGVTYAHKIDKAETRIDFDQDAASVERQIRAFAPAPGAWFNWGGTRHKILAATLAPDMPAPDTPAPDMAAPGTVMDDQLTIACRTGAICPTRIQRAGKPVMDTADLLRGKPIAPGTLIA